MEFEKSRIERLKQSLYSRDESRVPQEKRTPVQSSEFNVQKDWGTPKSFAFTEEPMAGRNNSFFNRFLLGSIIFFVLALGVALFIFFGGLNMISSSNVDIKILGPSSVSSGESLDLTVTVMNQNRTDLQSATLYIDYPEGAKSAEGQPLLHDKIDLATIKKGASANYALQALLFGQKESVKTITFKLEYKISGSNAVFSKEKTYDVSIGSSPLLLNVSYPHEVNSGQQVTLSMDITSNASVPVQNTLVKVEYPYGFTYLDSNIKPVSGNSTWSIGDLKNGDKKTLTIKGTIVGQDLEERSFRLYVGTPNAASSQDIDTTLASTLATMSIRKSFFNLDVKPTGGGVAKSGDRVSVNVNWQNTLPSRVTNNRIEVSFSGNAFDRGQVNGSNGAFYRSSDATVLWDKNSNPDLTEFAPGDTGQVSFAVGSLPVPLVGSQSRPIKNPHIDIHVSMTGTKGGTDQTEISSTDDTTIKIASQIALTARSYRSVGPFSNTGPIPPRADTESTYTVTWTLTNSSNDLTGASVSATLPTGVVWKEQTSPASERISYNPDTRQVVWNLGNVSAGVGYAYLPREASFKVGVTPSVTQVGLTLDLVSQSAIQATDSYTLTPLTTTASPVNIRFSDPSARSGDDVVVR